MQSQESAPSSISTNNATLSLSGCTQEAEGKRQLALTRPSIKTPVQPSGTKVPFRVTVNLDNDYVYHKGIPKAGNNKMISNQKVAIEVNMNSNPRTAHLFIDGKQQPVFISGFPSSIQFFFQLYYEDDQIQILSLKRLNEPTVQIVEKAEEVKYYVNKAL
ncbi:MAG: hypothetical protein EZS28_024650 [Streblomastix strix]|uniref:Uncharacterized protein n=1 Tax=Streblomastix strix TaxID=222440 RepID=A0A5J4VBM7_9EUKA|nr:MAG: hypothetical protein EZS28_024650 [Streblomastix strix]